MGESTSYSMMGSVLKPSQDREGVRIDTPHGWVINDVHHEWTKNETYHWETGNIFHMTSGQVFHANLNLAEVHTTTNALTMHVDITPLNVHMRPLPIGFDVHIEASHFRKHVNVHGGHHHLLVSNFHQESQAVHIKSTTNAQSGWDKAADLLSHSPDHSGTMTLEADGEMKLRGNSVALNTGGSAGTIAKLDLGITQGAARIYTSKTVAVDSGTKTVVSGSNSFITLKKDTLDLKTARVTITLSNGNLTTSARSTTLNGKVTLGQPATSDVASKEEVEDVIKGTTDVLLNELDTLRGQIGELRARLA